MVSIIVVILSLSMRCKQILCIFLSLSCGIEMNQLESRWASICADHLNGLEMVASVS